MSIELQYIKRLMNTYYSQDFKQGVIVSISHDLIHLYVMWLIAYCSV